VRKVGVDMRQSYIFAAAVLAVLLAAAGSSAVEYQLVSGYTNCIGLQQAIQSTGVALTPGETYTVTVSGAAFANPAPGGDFEGLFCFYYDNNDPDHPVTVFLPKTDSFQFVASSTNFYAFLVDKTLKDVADNTGFFNVTLTGASGSREELTVDAVFNCIGLEDFGAAKKILIPGLSYTMTVSGEAYTNGTETGYYDGVLLFTRDASINPIHPLLVHLDFGEEFVVDEMHATGWVYCFLVDESYGTIGNNGGKLTVAFEEPTPVESSTWSHVKALFR
jgi:hypothetical protein